MVNNFIRRAQLSLYQSASGVCRRNKTHTLPSDASSNLTGLSRTDAKKQNDEGSEGEAVGNQVKSSIGADFARSSLVVLVHQDCKTIEEEAQEADLV